MTEAGWFVARGTGVTALVLLSAVVVLGVGSRSGRPVFGLPRFAVSLVHRNAALLAVGLLTVHVVTLLFDPYAKLRVYDLFVPFGAEYRPLYMGLGTLAGDVMLVLVVTSLLRRRIGVRLWRALHWLAYAAWPAALGHSVGTGTDSGQTWMVAVNAGCLAAVLGALGWRLLLWVRPRSRRRATDDAPRPGGQAPGGSHRRSGLTTDEAAVRPPTDWLHADPPGDRASAGYRPAVPVGYRPAGPAGYQPAEYQPTGPMWDRPPAVVGQAEHPVDSYVGGRAAASVPSSLLDMYRKPGSVFQPADPPGWLPDAGADGDLVARRPPEAGAIPPYGDSEGYRIAGQRSGTQGGVRARAGRAVRPE
ncbi:MULTISPECIES: ferric reductase-like transmembrane domain-containing protein [unclassified Solwaraspora]|uniref:ferric reductase-like transmembrane domain-containing protein n=1 Tax=unclassified Solwaraspora TaxID=2627926 RepID=UPI00248D0153|nr:MULTISPECIES: ferric reductase-like transmembrane domain-containing protein [unclassified Solwaraspora]WBB98962.1 ferric reductase-like transmembrane domain-containing protein [Solwaraspora sp. WMMA2059]WBC22485.1 ferric reductase-like transmembrane domain-containing protein [Solwaraspora sp. WMMA2080]WJK35462.1 ferric reductase-like transmembrane domain-containing protein [Solwaraspora sp. WMMA2065]